MSGAVWVVLGLEGCCCGGYVRAAQDQHQQDEIQ